MQEVDVASQDPVRADQPQSTQQLATCLGHNRQDGTPGRQQEHRVKERRASTERTAAMRGFVPDGAAAVDGTAAIDADGPGPVGIIYDIQGFSVQDGPGIRTTVFLKGCPLHCPWCHSPESQRFDIQLSWQARKCIGTERCGLCVPACPRGALSPGEVVSSPATGEEVRLVEVAWDKCDDCGLCAEACPAGALSMWGNEYTVAEVVGKVLRDRPFFERSGGGVTISGGEPLSQPAYTLALLRAFKKSGVHTALDTTGFASWEVVERVLPFTDLFLLDLKHVDNASHRSATGVANERILDNARRMAQAGARMQIRVPLIPRFNDSEEHIHRVGTFVKELGEAVTSVQLLPYHAMGVPKLERIRHAGPVVEAAQLSDEQVERIKAILDGYGLVVTIH